MMKRCSEVRALFAAVAVSIASLLATFGFAELMRNTRFAARWPDFPPAAQAKIVSPIVSGDAEKGHHLFLMNCAHCHGDDARGDEGPDLHQLRKSDARIHQVITGGIKGEMPSFAKKLNESDVQALTAYLRTLQS